MISRDCPTTVSLQCRTDATNAKTRARHLLLSGTYVVRAYYCGAPRHRSSTSRAEAASGGRVRLTRSQPGLLWHSRHPLLGLIVPLPRQPTPDPLHQDSKQTIAGHDAPCSARRHRLHKKQSALTQRRNETREQKPISHLSGDGGLAVAVQRRKESTLAVHGRLQREKGKDTSETVRSDAIIKKAFVHTCVLLFI